MKLNFKDSNLVIKYLQIKLKEQYNPDVLITGDYYITNNNNYGMAHYIARYLNTIYPPLMVNPENPKDLIIDNAYSINNSDDVFDTVRSLTDTISIANYFLCNNKGEKLYCDLLPPPPVEEEEQETLYRQIYGHDICGIFNVLDSPLFVTTDLLDTAPVDYRKPVTDKIHDYYLADNINNTAKKDRIYPLDKWESDKEICEIDDLVLSYLLGKTITPNSSAEEIYYVQRLFYGEYIPEVDKGVWSSDYGNLTDTIKEYQRAHTNPVLTNPLFVTGYFDIFTEASILRDRGEQTYGIYGL